MVNFGSKVPTETKQEVIEEGGSRKLALGMRMVRGVVGLFLLILLGRLEV